MDNDDERDPDIVRGRQVSVSQNGRRIRQTARSPVKKGKTRLCVPAVALPDWSPSAEWEDINLEDIEMIMEEEIPKEPTKTGKRYKASDAPLLEWLPYCPEYVREMLRLEGRGDAMDRPCPSCRSHPEVDEESERAEALFRCRECFGGILECKRCCLRHHSLLPIHRIQMWNGTHFEDVSLREMGLRIQLGHMYDDCVNPAPAGKHFTVLHTTGLHRVSVDYCNCERAVPRRVQLLRAGWFPATVHFPATCTTIELLRHYHCLTLTAKLSVHEFYLTMERLTDNLGIKTPKTRYRAFGRMVNEFQHIRLMKHAGRGNLSNGVETTGPGDLALRCAACPDPEENLPEDWQNADEETKQMYSLLVLLDANFRLKNRMRSSEAADPGLHTGKAYFVEQSAYKTHLDKYISQPLTSSCSGFNAVTHAESKSTRGLRYTGVGMCVCARHEFVRPVGVGDLLQGEKFCIMDYLLLSSIAPVKVENLMVIYDIACQWKVKFRDRMADMPSRLQIPSSVKIDYAIPKCHAPAHKQSCQTPHSLSLIPGVGRTDGEGIERDWSEFNGIANSTKEMGPCTRHDTLDDHFGHHNWRKTVGFGLQRKLMLGLIEHRHQAALHDEFTRSLDPGYEEKWTSLILAWEKDKDSFNPYELGDVPHKTENNIKFEMIEEERLEMLRKERPDLGLNQGPSAYITGALTTELPGLGVIAEGGLALNDVTPTGFLSLGLIVEEAQRRIRVQAAIPNPTRSQVAELQQKRVQCQKLIRRFRKLQKIYMPVVESLLTSDPTLARGSSTKGAAGKKSKQPASLDVEDTLLWMPSSIPEEMRAAVCKPHGLLEKEARLREAQCYDALEKIRCVQRARTHLSAFKKQNLRGQRENT
ncbi:hypothetical protein HGRIS_014200 [Hohenbuehelia grisea]|uniref:CxC2-like cysteine cluster KDZ transposase-associated domain-containing protein n=1 Tax=Hohenbuehelia grisea TaxID=104357 RepID=A0ABR3JTB1_9AGAR